MASSLLGRASKGPNNRRFGSDVYTASAQRRARERSNEWRGEYVGRLRLDLLLSETLVIPDTHLWDGVLMLDFGPEEFAKRLGGEIEDPTVPFEIRVRPRKAGDKLEYGLEVSLADFFLNRSDPSTLNIWKLNFLSDETTRADLRNELHGKSARGLERALASHSSVVDGLGHFLRMHLRGLGSPTDDLEQTLRSWKDWVGFEKRMVVKPWEGRFDIRNALFDNEIDRDDLTPLGWRWYQEVRAKVSESPNRASVEPIFDEMWTEATTDEERVDAHTIENWYSEGRHRALAQQHQTNWDFLQRTDGSPIGAARKLIFPRSKYFGLLVGNRPDEPAMLPSEERYEVERSLQYRGIAVPEGLREGLAQLDPHLYRALSAWAHSSQRGWAEVGDVDSLKRILDRTIVEVGTSATRQEFFAKAFYWQAAAVAGAVGLDQVPPSRSLRWCWRDTSRVSGP